MSITSEALYTASLPVQEEPVLIQATERQQVAHVTLVQADTDSEERLWIAAAKKGDLEAFDWLMLRYRDRAVRLAGHVLRRPAEAEDLVQEAFLRAFTQIQDFRGESHFYTWLYRIIVRCSLNRMRTPWWKRVFPIAERELEFTTGSESDNTENRMLIEMLLDSMSPPLRAAFVLRELEGLDYSKIAETLGVPVGTVRSRLNAARTQFKSLWQSAMDEVNHV